MANLGRNALCSCESGLKFKKCCIKKDKTSLNSSEQNTFDTITPKNIHPFSPFFMLMPSVEWKGYRLRFIFNQIHYHEPLQTFHEFLFHVIKLTFGERWGNSQRGMSDENKHPVFKWFENVAEFRREFSDRIAKESTAHGSVFSAKVDGPHQALLSLGWDLYCLQAKNKLPTDVLKKLIKNEKFQSFRYELAVAAIMVRAGFEIEWNNIFGLEGKKSEFTATHLQTRLRVTVEAKSLHAKRDEIASIDDKAKQIAQRLKDAEKKKENGIPHIVFIDINRPPDAAATCQDDLNYLKSIINRMPELSSEQPAKHEALFLTNFVPYYGGVGDPVPKYQHFPIIPLHSLDKGDLEFYFEIFRSLDSYSFIPKEV